MIQHDHVIFCDFESLVCSLFEKDWTSILRKAHNVIWPYHKVQKVCCTVSYTASMNISIFGHTVHKGSECYAQQG